jgi:hypothetical protein
MALFFKWGENMTETKKTTGGEVNPDIVKAFDLMWYHFPSPVFLLQRNRTIVGMNKAAKELGVMPGMKCFQLSGEKAIHEGCLGNSALKDGESKRSVMYVPAMKQVLDSYWLPIPGEKDMLIHFGIDITEYAKPEMFPSEE